LVSSYLKGTALTWFNQNHFGYWDHPQHTTVSFVPKFREQFCNPFKISQWKHQLRNRKQKPGETIEEYTAAIYELWKRIDPMNRRTELDRIHEFLEGLRPEFIVPVQSAMPASVDEAVEKAHAVETAFSIGMDLSVYSMLSGYLTSMNGAAIPAKTNVALYQSAYTAPQIDELSLEQRITKGIQEGILAAFAQKQQFTRPINNRANQRDERKCYKCNKPGHLARDCRQRTEPECYNCGRRGHLARDCYQRNNRQSQQIQFNQNNRQNQNNQRQRRNNRSSDRRNNQEERYNVNQYLNWSVHP
jgi:hypothetical protein